MPNPAPGRAALPALALALVLAACAGAPAEPTALPEGGTPAVSGTTAIGPASLPGGSAEESFAQIRDAYFVKNLQLYPVVATYLGGSGYSPALSAIDGRLKDYSPAALDAEVAAWKDFGSQLDSIDPSQLAAADAIDYQVIKAQMAFLNHQIAERRYYQRAVDSYVAEPLRGIDWQMQGMTDAGHGLLGTEGEWGYLLARLDAVPAYVKQAKANLQAGKEAGNLPDRRLVQRDGIQGAQANAQYFQTDLYQSARHYIGDRPFGAGLLPEIQAKGVAAAAAYTDFAQFLGQTYDLNETTDRYAAGTEEYNWRLKNNLRLDETADQLYDHAAREVASIEDQLFQVAEVVAKEQGLTLPFGSEAEKRASTRQVLDALAVDAPKDDEELLAWYRDSAAKAVQYGRDQALFDVPADYKLDIVETPPVLRSTIQAAYYPAPPFKGTGVGRFYLSPTGNDPSALRQNSRASVADTAVHEGFPGHDWHYKYMTEHKDEISNIRWLTPGAVEDSSAMWEDSLPTEGWALYAEELMAQPAQGQPYGFYNAAERLYELDGQLWRAVRVRVDSGLHTGKLSYEQARDYFTEHKSMFPGACAKAASDPDAKAVCDSAEREIYRYSKWPTQAITYNLGKRAVLALREAYKAQQGASYDQQAFHEKYMSMGTIPQGYFKAEFGEK